MKRYASSVVVLLLLAAAAGCSSGGSSGTIIPQNTVRGIALRDSHRADVSLHVRIPKRSHKRAHYVSPATVSATIEIAPKAGCATCSPGQTLKVALVATSAQCKSSPAALTCTLSFALGAGSYTGSISTYDAQGATLSENQSFPISISTGKSNSVGVTLYGVPAGVNITLTDPARGSQSFDATGQETIDIAGAGQAQLLVTPVDSDDYAIAGPGAPATSFAITGSSGFKAAATPGSPNVVTITMPTVASSTATDKLVVVLNGPACSQPHAVCGSSATLGFDTLVASAGNDTVEVQTAQAALVGSISLSPGSAPTSLAFDSHGHLFVAGSNMKVAEYAWPYRSAPLATFGKPTFGTGCPGMVVDTSNDVIVGQLGGISVYAPPYTGTPKSQAFVAPQCLAMDGSGNLYYVTAYGGGFLLAIPPPFFTGAYNIVATAGGVPTSIAADPADDIVGVLEGNWLYTYDKSLNVLQSTGLGSGSTNVADGDGYFAVGNGTGSSYAEWKASGLIYEGNGNAAGATVTAVALDSKSDVLVSTASGITFYATPANPQIRTNFLPTLNPATVITTWP